MGYERLIAIPMFLGVVPDVLKTIYAAGGIVKIATGEIIIREGEINQHMYMVLSGELAVSLPSNANRYSQVIIATRRQGECLGEYSFLDHQRAGATVTAKQPAELFKISHAAFNRILESDTDLERVLYKNLLVSLVERLRANDAELDLFRPI